MKTNTRTRYVRAVMMTAMCALITSACGVAYRQSSVIGAGRINKHSVLAGPARVTLHFGAEWVEIGIENLDSAAIEIDWNAIVMNESGVETHHLRELQFMREAQSRPFGTRVAIKTLFSMTPIHLRHTPSSAPALQTIPPRTGSTALLFVAEHMRRANGETTVGPLFCHGAAVAHADPEHVVELMIPVRFGTHRRTLHVTAVVAA